MATQEPPIASTDDMVRALVADKFAAFLELERWDNENPMLAYRSDRARQMYCCYKDEKKTAIYRYRLKLKGLSPAEVEEVVENRRFEVAQRPPDDERFFFNEPFANAAYAHWARQDTWSLEEFAALLLGKDPDVVDTGTLDRFYQSSAFAARFVTLLYTLQEAKERGELSERMAPSELLAWASAHQFEVPLELARSDKVSRPPPRNYCRLVG